MGDLNAGDRPAQGDDAGEAGQKCLVFLGVEAEAAMA